MWRSTVKFLVTLALCGDPIADCAGIASASGAPSHWSVGSADGVRWAASQRCIAGRRGGGGTGNV